ncbi:MAG: DUF1631 family protein [Thermomonas sp.]
MAVAGTDHQTPAALTLASAILPQRVRRALETQLQIARSDLGRRLLAVIIETEMQLGRQPAQRGLPKPQATTFGYSQLLRTAESGLVKSFLREIEAGLIDLHAPRDSRSLEDFTAPSLELSLVDDSDTNEGGILANIALRSDSRNSLALQLMGYRYGVLAGAPAFEAEHLPLGPHALCHAVRNAAEAAELPSELRLLLYTQFDKVAMSQYPELLDTLNATLADDGILPHLNFVPVRLRPASGDTAEASRAVDLSGTLDMPKAAGADTHPATSGPRPNQRGPHVASATGGSATPQQAAFGALQGLLARRRTLLSKLRRGGNAVAQGGRTPLDHDEVLDSLRRLRHASTKPGSLADIQQTLLAQARQMHGHGVALTGADSDSFELFSLFMAQLKREMRDGPGTSLIERLKLPLVQLALREHRFFVDPEHPARMLLDAVSLAGAPWLGDDDLDAQWLGLLQRAVATVQTDPEAAYDTFVTANHALQGGLLAASRKNEMAERRQVEAARGRERLELARQRAAGEITRLVNGRPLPRFHAVLLEQAWTDVLSLTLLRQGDDSTNWRELLADTAAIVEACTMPGTRQVDAVFLERLQLALGQVGYHAEDASAIALQLANGRGEDVDMASRTELIVQVRARARLGGDESSQPAHAHPPRTLPEQAAYATLAASTGARWLDIHDPVEERLIRRRLAWLSPRSGHALILNRRGQRVAYDELDALARMLVAGRLHVVAADIHPAELAWQATLANLARIAGDGDAKEASRG